MCTGPKTAQQAPEPPFIKQFVTKEPSAVPLSPEESMKKIQLPPGYHIELVASEPMVKEPVGLAWDGNGIMYVVQMNTYMKDANATDEYLPTSKIMRLEDTNGDGRMDKSTVFVDSLVLPRTILPIGDELFVGITNIQHIYAYKDTNGDGKADAKRIAFKNNAIDARNLEHQNGGLLWNLDNWIYPTRDNLRYKYKKGMLEVDTLVDNMIGQWGITSDNYGRLFYSEAGPGLPAVQIEQMPAYGALNIKDQYTTEFTIPFPIIGNVDAQGGLRALNPDNNTLTRFTSGAGQSIYRGDRLPGDMVGDYFIGEPVARVIKRGKVINKGGKIVIDNAYPDKDWLASADMNFRPINTYTGPDGCLYIVDMYHGIIQEGEWTGPNSYLGKKIVEMGLDKNTGRGRIYRVVHDSYKPSRTRPNLLNEPSSKLVTYLDHPNGWWRDNAQQLIIIRGDKSVVPILKDIATGGKGTLKQVPGPLARIHTLWTLEGLEAFDKPTLFLALTDADAEVRKTAVWISEHFIKQNDQEVIEKLASLANDPSPDVRIQLSLSLRTNKTEKAQAIVKDLLTNNPDNELMQYSYKVYLETKEKVEAERALARNLSEADRELVSKGAVIYKQLCATCHGADGKGIVMGGNPMPAPPLVGSPRVTGDKIAIVQLLLQGLKGEVDGKEYPAAMPSMATNDDEWIASVLSYVRNSSEFGHHVSVVTAEEVKKIRATTRLTPGGTTLRSLEIGKLGRAESQNWLGGKPGAAPPRAQQAVPAAQPATTTPLQTAPRN